MAFDKARYVEQYVKPRRAAGTLQGDDLAERYALTLPATDVEVAAAVKAVRAFWNGQRPGTSAAAISKLCTTEDERLRQAHGEAMLTAAWWNSRMSEAQEAARERVVELAEHLKREYGQLGVVTRRTLGDFCTRLGLKPAAGAAAAGQAGVTVVDDVELPDSPPIPAVQFRELCLHLEASGARTIPGLLHPGSGPFRIMRRYADLGNPALRLDAVAVGRARAEADRKGTSSTDTALRSALATVKTALGSGVDLDRLTLFHLATLATPHVPLGPLYTSTELAKLGLEASDCAHLAVLLAEQRSATGAGGIGRVEKLLSEGRLSEARQTAHSLPVESGDRDTALTRVDEARARLDELLREVTAALAVPDEARAAALLRDAAAISLDDAAARLATVPPTPPATLSLSSDGESVRLAWQPGLGHGEGTAYLVVRSEHAPPRTPADGQPVTTQPGTTFDDPRSPIARPVHYAVFATLPGRPASRPATGSVLLLPEIAGLDCEVGADEVTLHWTAHPSVDEVEVLRTAPGPATRLPVQGNSCGLSGLAEGEALHFEVTALYRGADGRLLRSKAAHVNATPRSEARPIGKLRATPIEVGGELRVRVSWTPVDRSDVRIVHAPVPSPWERGTWVTDEDVARYGAEVAGRRITGRSEQAIEAELPPGVHHLVPFSKGGSGTVVGEPTVVGVTAPVTRLEATAFSGHAVLAWLWPGSSQLAEVTWENEDDADLFVIGRAQYRTAGGARVPLGRQPCRVEVRALLEVAGRTFSSPPARLVVEALTEVEVRYSVSSSPGFGPFGGRSKKVSVVSAEGLSGGRLRVVATPGPVMPTSPDAGLALLEVPLDLAPGVPVVHAVTVPRAVPKPYWVRGFLVGGAGRLIDPPVRELKET